VTNAFRDRYGPWALITGASEGIGEHFARALAARGLHLLLVARRAGPLDALAAELRAAHGIQVRTATADVARPDLLAVLDALAGEDEVGLLVHNAAFSALGPFLDRSLADLNQVIDLNCRAPVAMAHHFGKKMAARGRGGILLMSSLAGGQGTPMVATYAASKAFETILAEGLWDELRPAGIDVLACRAGATRTPSYEASRPRKKVPMMESGPVVEDALAALGRQPVVVAGRFNRAVNFVMQRLLSRSAAIRLMGSNTRKMYE
jgi:short-subunit dehydrogenase